MYGLNGHSTNSYSSTLVLNIDADGTFKHQIGDILICNAFIDRDYEKCQLSEIEYEIKTLTSILPPAFWSWLSIIES